MIKKGLKKAISLLMALVIASGLLPVSVSANSSISYNFVGKGYDLKVEERVIDANTTEWVIEDNLTGQIDLLRTEIAANGKSLSYGWYDIANRNIVSYNALHSDMSAFVSDGKILYKEAGQNINILFTIDDIRELVRSPILNNVSTFPSSWASTPAEYGSIGTDIANALSLAALLAGIFSVGAGVLVGIASYIIANNIPIVYYKKIHYYRALEPLVQESYDIIYFYSDSEYSDLIDTVTTPTSTTYFG